MQRNRCILYVSQYFPPEVNAPANRVYELARIWAAHGRTVKVLTGFPNHPTGIILQPYRHKLYQRERIEGIEVHRCWMYAAPNQKLVRRALNYISFMLSAIIVGVTKTDKVDCVIATSPQLLVGFAGWFVALIKRVPFVFEVRDVWPEEIIAVGAIRNRLIIRCLEKLEMFLYRRAKRIVAVAEGTIEILTRRGVPLHKIALVPNGVDLDRFQGGKRNNRVREQLHLNGDFLISYIGTIGMAHNLETFLEAARFLRGTPRVKFLMVGDGAEKENLKRRAGQLGLDNMLFVEQQSREDIAAFYHASDCCLVHLRRAELFTKNVPSKIFEIMACGKPILLGTHGESKRLVARAGCGVFFEPENAADLAEGIQRLHRQPAWQRRLGQSGLQFVREHYSRTPLAEDYLRLLDAVMGVPIQPRHSARPLAMHRTPRPGRGRQRICRV